VVVPPVTTQLFRLPDSKSSLRSVLGVSSMKSWVTVVG
jgi:hypothetical protein